MLYLAATGLAVFVAGIVQGVTGFGFVIVSVPVLLFFLDPWTAVSLSQIWGFLVCLFVIGDAWRKVKPVEVAIMLLTNLPATWIGAQALLLWPASGIKMLAGAAVLLSTLPLAIGYRRRVQRERAGAAAAGVASGLLQGSCGLAGPPVVIFLSNQGWEKDTFRGSMSTFLAIGSLLTVVIFRLNGILHDEMLLQAVVLVPALVLGVLLGLRLAPRINVQRFRQIVNALIFITGVSSVATGLLTYLGALR